MEVDGLDDTNECITLRGTGKAVYGPKLRTLANAAQHEGDTVAMKEVLTGLRNRYRILLSRARKGMVIYCEDDMTREALRSILASGQVS